MEVLYAVVKQAVEATIEIEVTGGEFYGKITACISIIPNHLVLRDSKLVGVMNGNDKGVIQLSRPVVCVCLEEKLFVTIVVAQTDGSVECRDTIDFTPEISGRVGVEISVGVTKMLGKVAWSLIH
jgi:hypothetical protein